MWTVNKEIFGRIWNSNKLLKLSSISNNRSTNRKISKIDHKIPTKW
jgi:hypothetical protein